MSAHATEVLFLPGMDGDARLRGELLSTLAAVHPARGVGYPNRKLGSLEGYWRHVASQVAPDSRPVVIAESFSGIVAARWAANDPRVAGLLLCGAFARNPAPFAVRFGASMPSLARFVGLRLGGTRGQGWTGDLVAAIRALHADVIGERLRLIAREDVGPDLSALRIPLVLVQFEDDGIVRGPARRHLEQVCHNARIMRLPGPHFALETRPLECGRAIAECLAPFFGGARQDA